MGKSTIIFSISMSEEQEKEINSYLSDFKNKSGFSISRNQLIRQSVLTHIRFMSAIDNNQKIKYMDIFKESDK